MLRRNINPDRKVLARSMQRINRRLVALALVGAAWLKGWVALVIAGDATRRVILIAVVFGVGLVECACRALADQRRADAAPVRAVAR
jgi:hypothetical protein